MDESRNKPWNLHYCKFCPYGSKSALVISRHIKLHQRPKTDIFTCDSKAVELFECALCEFSTDLQVNLAEHFRNLHEEKGAMGDIEDILESHRCEKCDFKTHSLVVLVNHLEKNCNIMLASNSSKKKTFEVSGPSKIDKNNIFNEFTTLKPVVGHYLFKKIKIISDIQIQTDDSGRKRRISDNVVNETKSTKIPTLQGPGLEESHVNSSTDNESSNLGPTAKATTSGFCDQVMSMLIEIKEQNSQILNYLKGQTPNTATHMIQEDFPVALPLINQETLDEFECYLEDRANFANLILYLSSLGGHSMVSRTNIILKRLLTHQLASNYNFYGKRSQKKPFSNLLIRVAVVQAVKRSLPNVTDREVEDAIKLWLKHAPQRSKTERR